MCRWFVARCAYSYGYDPARAGECVRRVCGDGDAARCLEECLRVRTPGDCIEVCT